MREFEREIAQVRTQLEANFMNWSGVTIEDKRYSLAIHYRDAARRVAAQTAIHAAVSALPVRIRVVLGKLVVNLVPKRAPNKGNAMETLVRKEQASIALYVGDDVTDEDVFQIGQLPQLLTVRVGRSRASAAAFFLDDQREIDDLLVALVALRARDPRDGSSLLAL